MPQRFWTPLTSLSSMRTSFGYLDRKKVISFISFGEKGHRHQETNPQLAHSSMAAAKPPLANIPTSQMTISHRIVPTCEARPMLLRMLESEGCFFKGFPVGTTWGFSFSSSPRRKPHVKTRLSALLPLDSEALEVRWLMESVGEKKGMKYYSVIGGLWNKPIVWDPYETTSIWMVVDFNSNIFWNFTHYPWRNNDPIWRACFSDGLKTAPTHKFWFFGIFFETPADFAAIFMFNLKILSNFYASF